MGWSTRELAELAGTTVNTVRHYHRIGLLELPDRSSNGYKQYEVRHLVRLLKIRRLRDLDVPLDRINEVTDDDDSSTETLRLVDAELAASIERLQRARVEIRAILAGSSVAGVPAGFEDVASHLSEPDRSLMLIYEQLYDDTAMKDLRELLTADPDAASKEFDALTPDAEESVRGDLAVRLAVTLARTIADYPWLLDPGEHFSKSPAVTERTFLESVTALYNPAQLDVLARAGEIAKKLRTPDEP